MSMNNWTNIDIEKLDLLEVSELEKKRVKQYVLNKSSTMKLRRMPLWRTSMIAVVVILVVTTATAFAFPSFAAQIPFVNHIISSLKDDHHRFAQLPYYFEDINLVQKSNGITIAINQAIYDGRNVSISYSFETDSIHEEDFRVSGYNFLFINGREYQTSGEIMKLSDTQYVVFLNIIPFYEIDEFPETLDVIISPKFFFSTNEFVKGEWNFAFTLKKLDSKLAVVNASSVHEEVSITVKSLEFTDVSTIIKYEQLVTPGLLRKFGTIFPRLNITDNLGHVYFEERNSYDSGISANNYDLLQQFALTIGTINEEATTLIIKPSAEEAFVKNRIELEPIVIDLTAYR